MQQYAILCYHTEGQVCALSKAQDEAMMVELKRTHRSLEPKVRFGPIARLMPTTAATTLRTGRESVVLDGPFAETKEQLLGFYVVEADSLEDAIEAARALAAPREAAGLYGALEIRPLKYLELNAQP